ncbi:dynamin family protein [Brevibacillus migulae]|uniref:dynamin family protein n=1 Tax=Brevibacillus migulae TaxID=1644114 RepID=UPI00106F0705|nr:dynamin family protein [Brevibacillus migulae]
MNQLKQKLLETAQACKQVSDTISDVPGMLAQAKAMRERAGRLEANRFTVALFGAFSAGKSSFANALMGDLILPVSPNPTTAAINKIMPPDEQYPHGTVRVVLKSHAVLEQDVLRSLAVFGIQESGLDQALAALDSIDVTQIAATAKPHYTFLKAVKKGMADMEAHIGSELIVDMQAFKGFVAKEEKACFADYIELYYSCPLTDQGIVLVDTPGADSINARHTGVAFEYMKNADVVLFVTYYNHAFAQADREFLMQMGRVKETFELDKMFFLVNAADLAASEEELAGVVAHVEKNLLACGIRLPRIYPISSQTALLARMHGAGKLAGSAEKLYRQRTGAAEGGELMPMEQGLQLSGIAAFERDFNRFILEELTQMAVDAAQGEIKRAYDMLGEWLTLAKEGESARQAHKEAAEAARRQALQLVADLSVASEERDLAKEQEELLYYVKQRLFFRFNELFAYAFNPAVLKEDGRSIKQALQDCLQELTRSISYDLGQELRATSLRLEKFLNKLGASLAKEWEKSLAPLMHGATLSPYVHRQIQTPDFADELPATGEAQLQASLKLFKNTKDFFEQDGKTVMRESLEKAMQQPVSEYLQAGAQILTDCFTAAFADMVADERSRISEQIEEYFTGVFAALDMKIDMEALHSKHAAVERLLA